MRTWPEIAADLRKQQELIGGYRILDEAAVAGDALAAEVARLHSWAGIMSLLDEHYPSEVFDGSSGDPGPTIVTLTRQLSALDAQIARLATFIMDEVPGEPSQDQGAIDTAIRLLTERSALAAVVAAVHTALDQYEAAFKIDPFDFDAAADCVLAIAKAVRR